MTTASMRRPLSWPLWSGIAAILLLPLIAMQFTRDVAWTGSDFLAAAVLLAGGGVAYEWAVRTVRRPGRRLIVIMLIAAVVLIIWAQGAVGIF
jgi:hypothetical protein